MEIRAGDQRGERLARRVGIEVHRNAHYH